MRERERLERNVTDAAPLRFEEQRQVGVAEAVDRLHRIADEEQRSAVAALPSGGQQLEQLHLRLRRILELVDEQVLDTPIEREQQLGRRVDAPERAARREAELDEVDAPRVGELHLELGGEVQQDDAQRLELPPLRVRVARLGELLHGTQAETEPFVSFEPREKAIAAFAGRAMLLAEPFPLR